MKYAIRHIGSSDFLSGFDTFGEPEWVAGWDNSDMLLFLTQEDAADNLRTVSTLSGLNAMIEEITE